MMMMMMMMRKAVFVSVVVLALPWSGASFQPGLRPSAVTVSSSTRLYGSADDAWSSRRGVLTSAAAALATVAAAPPTAAWADAPDAEFVQKYADFTAGPGTDDLWRYRDVKLGAEGGAPPATGDRVVFEWSGYTVGYFGRPFEAKGGPQGGAFDKEVDFSRTVLGSGTVVPALDAALRTMRPGGVRQVLVPFGPQGYPVDYKKNNDADHARVGPKPSTFSGVRALNFVLENPRVDRTLLFNVKLVRLDRQDGKGGFKRG